MRPSLNWNQSNLSNPSFNNPRHPISPEDIDTYREDRDHVWSQIKTDTKALDELAEEYEAKGQICR